MPFIELPELLNSLAACRDWNYHADGPVSTEPAAHAALALMAHRRISDARPALDWLAGLQAADGSLGVTSTQSAPTWPTSLAVVAWCHYRRVANDSRFDPMIEAARAYLLSQRGTSFPLNEHTGHDTTLVGWSWAAATHSWIEPTAMHVWALKAAGLGDHARTREAVRLLIDRQLPDGGCNVGNTFVLKQKLLPRYQPSAIALLAMASESETTTPNIERRDVSLAFLDRNWANVIGTSSVCYSAMALAAYDRVPVDLGTRLQGLLNRRRPTIGTYPLALIAMAAAGRECPLAVLETEAVG